MVTLQGQGCCVQSASDYSRLSTGRVRYGCNPDAYKHSSAKVQATLVAQIPFTGIFIEILHEVSSQKL
jgi:hypothetical protein